MSPQTSQTLRSPAAVATVTLAVLAVLFAMREAKTVVVPTLLACFLAAVADAPVAWLERKGLTRILSVVLVVTGMTVLAAAIGVLVGSSLQELTERAPTFQQKTRDLLDSFFTRWGGPRIGDETAGILDYISPDAALGLAAGVLTSVRDLLSSAILIIFLMIFMLSEVPSLRSKLEGLAGAPGDGPSIPGIIRHYLVIKTAASLATGVLIGLFLTVLDVNYAALWGLLAYLLNYIPSIGSFIASIPAVLLTLIQQGPGLALGVAIGYLLINLAIGNGIEPRILGQGLGLSTLVVFLSLILWGWLLGPVGMLLSTPLTTSVKIVLARHASTRSIALLLGRTLPPGSVAEPQPIAEPESPAELDAGGGARTPTPEGGGF